MRGSDLTVLNIIPEKDSRIFAWTGSSAESIIELLSCHGYSPLQESCMPVHCMIALFQWRNRVVAEELSVPIWGQGFFFPQKQTETRESSAESPDFRDSAIPAKGKKEECV